MATPARTVRIDDEAWTRWQAYAKKKGIPISSLIKRAVEDWMAEPALRRTDPPARLRQEQSLAKKDVKPDPKVKPKPKK